MRKKQFLSTVAVAAAFVVLSSPVLTAATVINMNFTLSTTVTTATNPGYGLWGQGANTWNLSGQFTGSSLKDSTGVATTVGYAYSHSGRNQNVGWGPDDLTNQGFFNSNDAVTIGTLTLSGLIANQAYELLVFHPNSLKIETETANGQSPVDFTGSTGAYTDAFDSTTTNHFWYYSSVTSNGSGQIVVTTNGAGHDVLAGFQIQSIPEPSIPLLSCIGVIGLLYFRRR